MDREVRQISVITDSEHPPVTTIDIDTKLTALLLLSFILWFGNDYRVRGRISIPCFGHISDYL